MFPNVETIDLFSVRVGASGVGVSSFEIFDHAPSLTDLNAGVHRNTWRPQVNPPTGLEDFATTHTGLTALKLTTMRLDRRGLLLPFASDRLRSLNLLAAVPHMKDLVTVVGACPALTSLNISYLTVRNRDVLEALPASLEVLKIDHCRQTTDNGVRAVVRQCPDLRVLSARGENDVTFAGWEEVVRALPFLELLDIRNSPAGNLGDLAQAAPIGAVIRI